MVSSTIIKIHGRSSYRAAITYTSETTGEPVDLSTKTIFFEIDRGRFRKELEPFTGDDATIRIFYLSRAEVDQLPDSLTDYAFLDETKIGGEGILGIGKIQRVGWVVR